MSEPRIGDLEHRLIIEEPSDLQDSASGEIVKAPWLPVATVWASIKPSRGREALISGQVLAELDTEIVVKWSPLTDRLSAKNRFRHKSDVYNIVSVVPTKLDRSYVVFACKSGANDG